MTAAWFAISPEDAVFTRLSLDFGLRGALLHFNELVVPGIGGARFVRQFSWAVAGLALQMDPMIRERRLRATPLANAVEALACKTHFIHSSGDDTERIIGTRAFSRDGPAVSTFAELRQTRHYVQNTFRSRLVRALRTDTGLGLATGTRFETMVLTPAGEEIAAVFLDRQHVGRGGRALRGWLAEWVCGHRGTSWPSLASVLSPSEPPERERAAIRRRLLDLDTVSSERRRQVADVLENDGFDNAISVVRALRRRKQDALARDIELALAFGEFLGAAVRAMGSLTDELDSHGPRPLKFFASALAEDLAAIRRAGATYLERERSTSSGHPEARALGQRATNAAPALLLRHLIESEGRVTSVVDDRVFKGPLFRNLLLERPEQETDEDDVDEEEQARRNGSFRLDRFHQLLLDTRGARR